MHVTFNHGPYDGFRFYTEGADGDYVMLPVCTQLLWMLSGERETRAITIRAVAIYHLAKTPRSVREGYSHYQFAGWRCAEAQELPELIAWCEKMIGAGIK